MPCAGDIREDNHFVERIFTRLKELKSAELRRETARRMQALVDGGGARRLAEALLEH